MKTLETALLGGLKKEQREKRGYNLQRIQEKGKSERGKKANERDEFEIISGWDLFIIT